MDLSKLSNHFSLLDEVKYGILLMNSIGEVIYFNQEAEKIIGVSLEIKKHIREVIPQSELPRVIKTKRFEMDRLFQLSNSCMIRISRVPLLNKNQESIGALAIFEEDTTRKQDWVSKDNLYKAMEIIMQLCGQPISIVDECGSSVMKNPAYDHFMQKIQEDKERDSVNQISKDVHKKTLESRRMVEKEINTEIVKGKLFASPLMVEGKLTGSVQVIQNDTEKIKLHSELNRSRQLIRSLESFYLFDDFITNSPLMKLAIEQGKLAAKSDYLLFLRGAEGSGKDMLARAIHNEGNYKFNSFNKINCLKDMDKIQEFLHQQTENEDQKKWFGTIYLDDVTFLSKKNQQRLYDLILKEANETKRTFRIIVSSSCNIEQVMMRGEFFERLYYELMKTTIHIPSLNERKEDIPSLAYLFLHQLNREFGYQVEEIDDQALLFLKNYSFAGNIRELKALLQMAVIQVGKTVNIIQKNHLNIQVGWNKEETDFSPNEPQSETESDDQTLSNLVEKYEKVIIEKTLRKLDGNKTLAAKKLGLSVRNLYYKLEKYHLN